MQQLELSATGVPLWEIEPVLGVVVLALSAAALWPNSGKSRKNKQKKLPFFQRIQNLSGRFACLGLASAITAEVITGKVCCQPIALHIAERSASCTNTVFVESLCTASCHDLRLQASCLAYA